MVFSIGAGAFTTSNFAQSLHNIYNVSDQDGDGFLSLSEFDLAGKSEIYARGLIDKFDRNGDGRLSQAELIAGTLEMLAGDIKKRPDNKDMYRYFHIINAANLFLLEYSQSVEGDGESSPFT